MLQGGPKVSSVRAVAVPRPMARGGVLGQRRTVESSGLGVAVACVAAAILLYLVATLVWGFEDDVGDGMLGDGRSSGIPQRG